MICHSPATVAVLVALGARIVATQDTGRRVEFTLADVPGDWQQRIANDATLRSIVSTSEYAEREIRRLVQQRKASSLTA
jgi:hypothetical protein